MMLASSVNDPGPGLNASLAKIDGINMQGSSSLATE